MELSTRLKTVAETIKHSTLADVGCDHGYLPIYLAKQAKITRALATDISPGPLSNAAANIKAHGVADIVTARLCTGLEGIAANEYECCVIAGMGGTEIIGILHGNLYTAKSFKQLILSPQKDVRDVRRFLWDNGFVIVDEVMIIDGGKFYNIMDCAIGSHPRPTDEEFLFGRHLIERKCPVFVSYLEAEISKIRRIISFIDDSNPRKAELHKYLETCAKIRDL